MSDDVLRCFNCRTPLEPRTEDHATVDMNAEGGRQGWHRGHLCAECEQDFAEKMKQTTGGVV